SASTAPPTSQPIPDLTVQTQAEKALQKLYKSDYESTAPIDRQALAHKLLREALETRYYWTSRYVMLRDARDIAARCGDLTAALKAIDDLGRVYGVNVADMTISTLNTAGRASDTVPQLEAVIRGVLSCMDTAAGRDDYEFA